MGDGQEADQCAVLEKLQDLRLICQTPEDTNHTKYFESKNKSIRRKGFNYNQRKILCLNTYSQCLRFLSESLLVDANLLYLRNEHL